MRNVQRHVAHRHRVAVSQPARRFERAAGGKTEHLRLRRKSVYPELVVRMRSFDRQMQLLRQILRCTGVVEMTGDVLMTQGPAAIKGQKLTIDLKTGTGRMEGGVTTTFTPGGN